MKLFDRLIDHVVDRVMARVEQNRKGRGTKVRHDFAFASAALAGEGAGHQIGEALKRGGVRQVIADTAELKRSIESAVAKAEEERRH